MAKKDIFMTEDGLVKLQDELKELVETKRPEVVGRIKTAKELGDLSENAEYSSAKEDQSFIEGRIQEIEHILKYAKVVNTTQAGTIGIGNNVTAVVEGDEFSFELVGETESDPEKGKISIDSPVGLAIAGHKVGDKVTVQTPDGAVDYLVKVVS